MSWLANFAFGLIAPYQHILGCSLMRNRRLRPLLLPLRQQPQQLNNKTQRHHHRQHDPPRWRTDGRTSPSAQGKTVAFRQKSQSLSRKRDLHALTPSLSVWRSRPPFLLLLLLLLLPMLTTLSL